MKFSDAANRSVHFGRMFGARTPDRALFGLQNMVAADAAALLAQIDSMRGALRAHGDESAKELLEFGDALRRELETPAVP